MKTSKHEKIIIVIILILFCTCVLGIPSYRIYDDNKNKVVVNQTALENTEESVNDIDINTTENTNIEADKWANKKLAEYIAEVNNKAYNIDTISFNIDEYNFQFPIQAKNMIENSILSLDAIELRYNDEICRQQKFNKEYSIISFHNYDKQSESIYNSYIASLILNKDNSKMHIGDSTIQIGDSLETVSKILVDNNYSISCADISRELINNDNITSKFEYNNGIKSNITTNSHRESNINLRCASLNNGDEIDYTDYTMKFNVNNELYEINIDFRRINKDVLKNIYREEFI